LTIIELKFIYVLGPVSLNIQVILNHSSARRRKRKLNLFNG